MQKTNTNIHRQGEKVNGTYNGQGEIDTQSGHYVKVSSNTPEFINTDLNNFNDKATAESVAAILLKVNQESKKESNKNKFMKKDANTNGKDVLAKYFNYDPQNNENKEEYDKKFKSALCKQILFAVSGLASRCISNNRVGLNKTVKHHFRHWGDKRLSDMLNEISNENYYKFFNDACIGWTRGSKETSNANYYMTWLARDLNKFLSSKEGDLEYQVTRLLNVVDSYSRDIHQNCTTCGCKGLDAVPFYGGKLETNAFRQGRRGAYRIMNKIGLPDFMTRSGSHNLSKYDCLFDLGTAYNKQRITK